MRDLKIGLHFLWQDQVLRWISLTLAISNAFGAPFFSLIIAVYIKERYDDPRYLGLLLSATGVGLLLGTTLYGAVGYRWSRAHIMRLAMILITLSYWPFGFQLSFPVLMVFVAIGGFVDGPLNPLLVTIRLERIPTELRGRVFAATSAMAQMFPAFTIPLAGWMIERFDLTPTVFILAAGAQIANLLMARLPVWDRLDETANREVAVAA